MFTKIIKITIKIILTIAIFSITSIIYTGYTDAYGHGVGSALINGVGIVAVILTWFPHILKRFRK